MPASCHEAVPRSTSPTTFGTLNEEWNVYSLAELAEPCCATLSVFSRTYAFVGALHVPHEILGLEDIVMLQSHPEWPRGLLWKLEVGCFDEGFGARARKRIVAQVDLLDVLAVRENLRQNLRRFVIYFVIEELQNAQVGRALADVHNATDALRTKLVLGEVYLCKGKLVARVIL